MITNLINQHPVIPKSLMIAKYLIYSILGVLIIQSIIATLSYKGWMEPLQPVDLNLPYLGPIGNIMMMVLIVPIIEELIWRLPLTYSPKYLSISISLVLIIALFTVRWLIPMNRWVLVLIVAAVGFAAWRLLRRLLEEDDRGQGRIRTFYSNHAQGIVLFSLITFAMSHLSVFQTLTTAQLYFLPIILAPYAVTGHFMNRLRLQYGIGWSILFHCIYNGIGTIPEIWAKLINAFQ